jgi:hypothetical protein
MYKLSKSFVVFICLLSALVPAMARNIGRDTLTPIVFGISPTNPAPGQTVQCTVVMSGAAQSDTKVSISCSNPAVFSSLPDAVLVSQDNDRVTFSATVSTAAEGMFVLSATANGGTALSPAAIIGG